MKIEKMHTAWAIDTGDGSFLGKLWFTRVPLIGLDGYKTATFPSRERARNAVRVYKVKDCYPQARPVLVGIRITGNGTH